MYALKKTEVPIFIVYFLSILSLREATRHSALRIGDREAEALVQSVATTRIPECIALCV